MEIYIYLFIDVWPDTVQKGTFGEHLRESIALQ
jgi:hypothetical protein